MFGGSGDDTVSSTGGTDVTIVGGQGTDSMSANDSLQAVNGTTITLFGGSGDDTLSSTGGTSITVIGGTGNDTLSSSGGTSITLFGGSGNDSVSSTGGNDVTVIGGGGIDTVSSSGGTSITLFGGSGDDTVSSSGGTDITVIGGTGNDSLSTSGGTSITLFGGSGTDTMSSSGGTDVTVVGGTGNDSISSGPDSSGSGATSITLFGGSGDDTITSTGGLDISVLGGTGTDSLTSSGGTTITLYGGSGNDTVSSTGGTDVTVIGGTGNDSLSTSGGTSITLFGGSGTDTLSSTGGLDVTMIGGSGQDTMSEVNGTGVTLFGSQQNDILAVNGGTGLVVYGGDGNKFYLISGSLADPTSVALNDLYTVGLNQQLNDNANPGVNTIEFPGVTDGITLDLSNTALVAGENFVQNVAVDPNTHTPYIQIALTGLFQDVLGTPGPSKITGDAADNFLEGQGNNDTLLGGSGPATLMAGSGNTTLQGGSGGDVYYLNGSNLGNVFIQPASNASNDTLDFAPWAGPVTVNLASTATQIVTPSALSLTLANPLGITSVVGNAAGDMLTGNARGDSFLLTGNNTVTGGGGNDTFSFNGSPDGTVVLNEQPGTSNMLDFQGLNAPINLDLSNPIQQQVSNDPLYLTLSNPNAFSAVVGTTFSDTIRGNAANDTIVGAGGNDSLVAGTGNDLLQSGSTQVVYLDFTSQIAFGGWVYTPDQQAAIVADLQALYQDFDYAFTTDPTVAATLAQPVGGQFITMTFNAGPAGGASNDINWRQLTYVGEVTINVAPLLGLSAGPNTVVALSTEIAAHELGHQSGLRHADAFGPIGTGVYAGIGSAVARFTDPTQYAALPGNGPLDTSTSSPDTPYDVMASPESVGIPLTDSEGTTYFGERDDVKLAFDENGTTVGEQAGNISLATAQALTLPALQVPNTVSPNSPDYGKVFEVHAEDVVGAFTAAGTEFYSFAGNAGDVMNFATMSASLQRIANPIAPVMSLYNANGVLLASSNGDLETSDPIIYDYTLAASGTYYVEIQSPTAGSYELFLYNFAAVLPGATTPPPTGDTLVAGPGNDTVVGNAANDIVRFLPNTAVGHVTIKAGSGTDVVDLTNAPLEAVTAFGSVKVQNAFTLTAPTLQILGSNSIAEGTPATLNAVASDNDPADTYTYSLVGPSYGASIDPHSGAITWVPTQPGPYTLTVQTADAYGQAPVSTPINVTVYAVAPVLDFIPNQTVAEGGTIAFTALATVPDGQLTYSVSGAPTGSTFNAPSGSFTWTPGVSGTYTVHVVATDASKLFAAQDVTITVTNVAPAVTLAANATPFLHNGVAVANGIQDDTFAATGSFSDPGSGETWTATVNYGDGTSGPLALNANKTFALSHPYQLPGTYTVTVAVTDSGDAQGHGALTGTATTTVTVFDAPVSDSITNAPASGNVTVNEGAPITLQGSYTSQATADSFAYTWHVASGTGQSVPDGSISSFIFTPVGQGAYTVTFTATDTTTGTAAAQSITVTSLNVAPSNLTLTPSATKINENGSITLGGSFSDPGTLKTHAVTINWGDGSANTTLNLAAGVTSFSGAGHQYLDNPVAPNGTFPLAVTVADSTGATTQSTTAIEVDNVAPSNLELGQSATQLSENSPLTLSGTFTDPGTLDTHTVVISWGDGGSTTINLNAGVLSFSAPHSYQSPPLTPGMVTGPASGSYSITVNVTDKDGGSTSGSTSVAVSNVAPSNVILTPSAAKINVGDTLTLGGSFTAVGAGDTHSVVISWGDGGSSTINLNAGVLIFSGAQHRYLNNSVGNPNGSYPIAVTVSDNFGGTSNPVGTANIVVNAVSPQVTVTNLSGAVTENGTFTGTGTYSDVQSGSFTATVNYGDGSGTQALALSAASGSSGTFALSHPYAKIGSYPVTVNVGLANVAVASTQAGTTEAVTAAPFTSVSISGGTTTTLGAGLTLQGNYANAALGNGSPSGETPSYLWTVANGSGTVAVNNNTVDPFTFAPSTPGIYTVTVNVTDAPGNQTGTASTTVTIYQALAAQLAFTTASVGTFAGFNLNSSLNGVQVSVEDQYGNLKTGDSSTVTLSIASGPIGGAFTSGSVTFLAAQNGVAAFTSVAFNESGTYVLKATDGSLAYATATVVISPNTGILLLDPTGQSLQLSGNATLNVTNYGAIVVDSSNAAAVLASGGASITTSEIDITGGLSTSGNAAVHGVVNKGAAALTDPLAGLAAPSRPSTTFTAGSYSGTLQPGTYVGGITVSGNNSVTLQAGVYYLTGGGLTVSSNATVSGTAVLLYITGLTGSNPTGVNISGNASVTLTPPTSGTDQGVVIFQDRTSNAAIIISGNGTLNTTGTIYAPKATVTLSGNDTDDTVASPTHTSLGSEWIVADLVLSGNAKFSITADANNRAQNPNAFMVAGGPINPLVPVAALTLGQADAAIAEALVLWAAAGLDAGTLQALSRTTVVIEPLPTGYLGLAAPGVIYLDPTAEGYGWFTAVSPTATTPGNEIDLLTVVAHELGHEFGLMDGNGTALMAPTLAAGVRILPDAGDLQAPHTTLAAPPLLAGQPGAPLVAAFPGAARVTPPQATPVFAITPAAVASPSAEAPGSAAFSRVLLIGQASDNLQVAGCVSPLAGIRAGSGDTTLVGGGGATILIGGAGNDLLIGGVGRNLLIGGFGQATMIDGLDSDIPIGGQTNYDQNDGALLSLMQEWTSSDNWTLRIADIMGTATASTSAHANDLIFAECGDLALSILSQDDVIQVTS